MTYTPINVGRGRSKGITTNTGSVKGIDLLTDSELVGANYAQNIENYFIEGDGELIKRKGRSEHIKFKKLTLTGINTPFVENEKVTGDISGDTGYVIKVDGSTLWLCGVTGNFQNAEGVTGDIAGDATISNISTLDEPITMLNRFNSTLWIIGLSNKVISYNNSSKKTVVLKGDFLTDDPFSGWKFGDYFYFTNGSTRIQYVTLKFTDELVTPTDWLRQGLGGFSIIPSSTNPTYNNILSEEDKVLYVDNVTGVGVPTIGETVNNGGTDTGVLSGAVNLGSNRWRLTFTSFSGTSGSVGGRNIADFDDGDTIANAGATWSGTQNGDCWIRGIENNDAVYGTTFGGSSDLATIAGRKYQVSYKNNNSVTKTNYHFGGSTGCFPLTDLETSSGTHSVVVRAQNSNSFLSVRYTPTASYGNAVLQDFSIKEQDLDQFDTVQTLVNSPYCKKLFIYNDRLVAGDIVGDPSNIKWSEQYVITSTDTPFETWSSANNPIYFTDPNGVRYDELGAVSAFSILGAQLVTFHDNGKAGLRIILAGDSPNFTQDVVIDFRQQDNGGFAAKLTPFGIFYTNEAGLWQMTSGGNTSQPFSESDVNISRILSTEFISGLDFRESDIIFHEDKNLVLVSCRQTETYNDLVIWYNIGNKSFGKITNWDMNVFIKYGAGSLGTVYYGADSGTSAVWELFPNSYFDGTSTITTKYEKEITLGLEGLHELLRTHIKAFVSSDSNITIYFDIYQKDGTLVTDRLQYDLDNPVSGDLQYMRYCKRTRLREFQRIIMRIESDDAAPHKITYVQLETTSKGRNTKNQNLT